MKSSFDSGSQGPLLRTWYLTIDKIVRTAPSGLTTLKKVALDQVRGQSACMTFHAHVDCLILIYIVILSLLKNIIAMQLIACLDRQMEPLGCVA